MEMLLRCGAMNLGSLLLGSADACSNTSPVSVTSAIRHYCVIVSLTVIGKFLLIAKMMPKFLTDGLCWVCNFYCCLLVYVTFVLGDSHV